jgi:hypothetical protein
MTSQANDFHLLRSSLSEHYAEASYEQLSGIVEAIYGPDSSPESVENLFQNIARGLRSSASSLGNFAGKVGPVVGRALPAMIKGATSGASIGGPWGAIAGAVLGGARSALQRSKNGASPKLGVGAGNGSGQDQNPLGGIVGSIRGLGLGGGAHALGSIASGIGGNAPDSGAILSALFGGGRVVDVGSSGQTPASTGGAANGLMGLMMRPEMLQALLSAGMGSFGNQNLQIAGNTVPVHNMLASLSTLAGRAASEAAEFAENAHVTPAYVENAAETLGLNPESAEGRMDTLLTMLALTASPWVMNRAPAQPVTVNFAQSEPSARYAPWPYESSIQGEWAEDDAVESSAIWPQWPAVQDFEWLEGGQQEQVDA